MKNTEKRYFLIGIGGIGMSALARYFHAQGAEVAGYDKTASELTQKLEAEGIPVFFEDSLDSIPAGFIDELDKLEVIRTPAVPSDSVLIRHFQHIGQPMKKRSEVLAEIARSKKCIAVAGTHGKTTTSSILGHILYRSSLGCTAFVGGVMSSYGRNVLINPDSEYVVLEADEFDRSFHHLAPQHAVITSVDPDHLDIYGDQKSFYEAFELFAQRVSDEGKVFAHEGVHLLDSSPQKITYNIGSGQLKANSVRVESGRFFFDLQWGEISMSTLSIALPGRHNVLNCLAACGVALELGVTEQEIRSALQSYGGVQRRFQQVYQGENTVYIDDYAHHPSEIDAAISSARELYPSKRLAVVFQPHLFSRTRDFMEGFAKSLSQADALCLLPIYPARENPIPGVTSKALFDQLSLTNKVLCEKEELIGHIAALEFEVLLTLGAGDIDRLVPTIKTHLGKT